MAIVKCRECGKEISNRANTCPHCGYPILAIKNAQIDQENREYYKRYSINQMIINFVVFCLSFVFGFYGGTGELKFWALGLWIVCFLLILALCFRWIPLLVHLIFFQRYRHVPRWVILVTFCFGYVIGGLIGWGN